MQGLIVALLEIKCDADPSVLSASAAQEAICWQCHQIDVEQLEAPRTACTSSNNNLEIILLRWIAAISLKLCLTEE
jgi:hypothetical protein